jgi:hypothetical protein
MVRAGFKDVQTDSNLFQVRGRYRKPTAWGDLEVTLRPGPDGTTELHMRSTGNMDNIFALFKSPNQRILEEFQAQLSNSI